jgi:hypothetical protein
VYLRALSLLLRIIQTQDGWHTLREIISPPVEQLPQLLWGKHRRHEIRQEEREIASGGIAFGLRFKESISWFKIYYSGHIRPRILQLYKPNIDIDLIKRRAIHWKYLCWSARSVVHTEREFGFIKQEVSCMATVKAYLPSLTPLYTCHTLNEVL